MSKALKLIEYLNEEATVEWKKCCELYHPQGSRYIAWKATDTKGKSFYQVTPDNSKPKSDGGYYSLESLMKLKNLKKKA